MGFGALPGIRPAGQGGYEAAGLRFALAMHSATELPCRAAAVHIQLIFINY